jgi:hypothetical protein
VHRRHGRAFNREISSAADTRYINVSSRTFVLRFGQVQSGIFIQLADFDYWARIAQSQRGLSAVPETLAKFFVCHWRKVWTAKNQGLEIFSAFKGLGIHRFYWIYEVCLRPGLAPLRRARAGSGVNLLAAGNPWRDRAYSG